MISLIRGDRTGFRVQVPSDTLNPHNFRFPGMADRHPRSASGRDGCFLFPLGAGRVSFPLVSLSAVFPDGDGQRVVAAGAQGPVARVVGEDDARGAQAIDQVRGPRGGRYPCEARPGTGSVLPQGPGKVVN